jgi:hypothetical protein
LPRAQDVHGRGRNAINKDLARRQSGEPDRFVGVPVPLGKVDEDRLAGGLEADLLRVLVAVVHSAPV